MTKRNVDLIIRARDEGSKVLDAFNATLEDLIGKNRGVGQSSQQAGSKITDYAREFINLDRSVAKLTGKYDSANAALSRQAASIAETTRSLASVKGQLASASAAAEKFRVGIDAATRSGGDTAPLQAKLKAAEGAIAALRKEAAGLERTLERQRGQYAENVAGLDSLERNLVAVTAAQRAAKTSADQVTESLERQAAARAKAGSVLPTIERTTGIARDRGDYDQLTAKLRQEAARAADEEAAAIVRLRNELNPLAVIEAKLSRETERLADWQRRGKISALEHERALELLRLQADRASRSFRGGRPAGGGGFLGLRPHELTNLSYQVNDVFTQLASGSGVMQTLAQQGGQIVQIFPRAGSAIAGAFKSGPALALVATIGTLTFALRNAANEAERLRAITAILAGNADAATYNADALSEATRAMQNFGLSAEDALAITRKFIAEGLNPDAFLQFAATTKDLADALGIEAADAAGKLAAVLTGGFEAVQSLDDATNALTATEREHIRSLFEEGRAAEARTAAYEIFADRMDDMAADARGPWRDAALALGSAWRTFLDYLSDTGPIDNFSRGLDAVGRQATAFFNRLAGTSRVVDIDVEIDSLRKQLRGVSAAGQELINGRIDALKRERAEIVRNQKAQRDSTVTTVAGTERERKATADLKRETDELKASREGASAAARLAAAEAKARREAERDVANDRFKFATDAAKQDFIAQRVADARLKVEGGISRERERQTKEAAKLAKLTQFILPADGPVTSGFGLRKRPKAGASKFHQGVDIAVPVGTTVRAPADGVVIETGYDSKLGKFVYIDHGNNVVSKFGHLSDNTIVSRNDQVTRGQTIARSGNTGNSTGPHLHYTVTVNGKPVDPLKGRFQTDFADAIAEREKEAEEAREARQQVQDRFNESLADEADRRQRNITAMEAERGLDGEALLAAQRRIAIQEALAAAAERLDDTNTQLRAQGLEELKLTDAQRQAVERLTAREFDLANAREAAAARRDTAERPLSSLAGQQSALRQQIELLRDRGLGSEADALLPQLDAINAKFRDAAQSAIAFYQAMDPATMADLGLTAGDVRAIVLELQNAIIEAQEFNRVLGLSVRDIADTFTGSAVSALDTFAQSIAQGANAFRSLWDAFRQFAFDFLRQIAQMIQQQLIFNLVSGLLRGIGGAVTPSAPTALPAFAGVKAHEGGIIGGAGPKPVMVRPEWFNNAMRMHSGGIAGIRPDEVPAILQRGEEVLTADDPRHALNGGGMPEVNLQVINALDAGDMVQKALGTPRGTRAVLNFIKANAGAVKGAIGS